MAKLDFYFDTKKVNEDIADWRDLEIEVNFEDESGQGTIKSGPMEFVGDLADKINTWNSKGLTGGAGILEAPPFRIEVCGNNQVIFDGGINTAECTASYECDKVVAPLRANTIDSLNDRASSFSFAYLASSEVTGVAHISQSDYISVPYVINSIPDYLNVLVAGMSIYMMLKETGEVVEKMPSIIADLSADVAVCATLIGISAIARVVGDIIRIGFYLLYLAFIISAIISLLEMIIDNLIQPVKYKKGMKSIDLFTKATSYLGVNFSSTILSGAAHSNDVIIPRKIAFDLNAPLHANKAIIRNLFGITTVNQKDYDDAKNPTSTGYFEGTFADLILAEQDRLNAEVRIIGNTLHFETKEYWANYANYTLPNIQRRNGDPHGTNACELASNYLISYSLDDQDTNTYDQYTGTSCQMQLSPIVIVNKKNILLKNLKEINLIYALAKRKEDLNTVEKIVSTIYDIISSIYTVVAKFINGILKIIDKIIKPVANLFGLKPPVTPKLNLMPPNPIQLRIGMMLLSSDFIGVPKVLVINSAGLLDSGNVLKTAARTLMDDLHFTNFAIRTSTTQGFQRNDHNQWLTYTDKEIPFCCGDYVSLLNNNFIKTYDQKLAKVKSLVWNPYRETAEITYRVKEKYTNNLQQKYIVDGKI